MRACAALIALASLVIAMPHVVHAQSGADSSRPERTVDGLRLAIVGGATVGGFVYGHVLQSNMWWKGERSAFHVEWERDWRYALGADKLGHAWFPYATAHTYDRLFRWTGIDSTTAIWSAAALALTYQTYVEVRDGFSADWGFSPGDMIANTIGAALPVAQHYVGPLRSLDYKISFYPSERFRRGANRAIIDDYESSYHWLTLHVADVLPDAWSESYPAFVDLAIGHGVKGLDDAGAGTHELFLALDWNLDRLPGDWWPWNLLRHIVRHYHLPSPALRLYPGPLQLGIRF